MSDFRHVAPDPLVGTVALVGEAPNACDYAEEIDACDVVVRLNRAKHCGKAGTRTDVLALMNIGPKGALMAKSWRVSEQAIAARPALWFVFRPKWLAMARAKQIEKHGENPARDAYMQDHTEALHKSVGALPGVFFLPADTTRNTTATLADFGAKQGTSPSTGAIVAQFLLAGSPQAHIKAFGFTHEGAWHGHPWNAEAAWFDHLCAEGRMARKPDTAAAR